MVWLTFLAINALGLEAGQCNRTKSGPDPRSTNQRAVFLFAVPHFSPLWLGRKRKREDAE